MKHKFTRVKYDDFLELFGFTEKEGEEYLEELLCRHLRVMVFNTRGAASKHGALEAEMKYKQKTVKKNLRDSWEKEIENHHQKMLLNEELEKRFSELFMPGELTASPQKI